MADIYALQADQVAPLEGFAEKSARQLVASIEACRQPTLSRFVFGLGIRHVGQQLARDLAVHFGSLERLQTASQADLAGVEGVGSVVAQSVRDWFEQPGHQQLLSRFQELAVVPQETQATKGVWSGQRLAITGRFQTGSRLEVRQLIQAAGGRVSGQVSQQVDWLVVGAKPSSTKLRQAQELGVATMSEEQWRQQQGLT